MDVGLGPSGTLPQITLGSRFTAQDGPVLLGGIQALVRLLLEQARADRAAGLHTAGLVSGYRGSPLGGLDQELWRRAEMLREHGIRFQPGLNEDLAVTLLWGSQQLDAFPGKQVDGVFGLWYGKGPGVDRSADALRHANTLGTSAHGGVVAVAGDDHAGQSSTVLHQSDQLFQSVYIPVLAPADAAELVSLGLAGYALSRFSGCWVALKTIAEVAEQGRTMRIPALHSWHLPADFAVPPHGLNYDPGVPMPGGRSELERRVIEERMPAVLAWARANALDRLVAGGPDAPIGLVTVGKAHHDAMHALTMLGLRRDPRIAVYKVGLSWPLETEGLRRFAAGRRALIVVEEKRANVETQARDALYALQAALRPEIFGKRDRDGATLMPEISELSPEIVARALARALRGLGLDAADPPEVPAAAREPGLLLRTPTFCAGCPHNTGTRLPEGSHAMAGIGCHFMALGDGSGGTRTFSHMGGEGVAWVGMSPFLEQKHVFANMGDGTYQHSGLLAIRQAVAVRVPITYKILFNDAVAMTGGQPTEGQPTPAQIAHQVAAEGIGRIALVADEAERLPPASALPAGVTRHTREELDAVQRELREYQGVSVLIYDQTCATEKRRRRKRGKMAPAARSVVINERVCENCGDCSAQSHCIAIEPVETPFGRKRRISPTACNNDLSCLKGFCPSFISIAAPHPPAHRVDARWERREAELAAALPAPDPRHPDGVWRALFAGIGGGGIVTAGAILAMAAHLEGLEVSTLDFTGLAQKNGAVVSHIQIGAEAPDVVRIPLREADFMLAADLAVASQPDVLRRCRKQGVVVGNLDLQSNAAFVRNRDLPIDAALHRRFVERATDPAASRYLHAAALCEHLFGDAQAMNTLLLGIAWQSGLLPVGDAAILRAIELNGTAIAVNRRAFLWGRIVATRPEIADEILTDLPESAPRDLDALVAHRAEELTRYQDAAYAGRYLALVGRARQRETEIAGAPGRLSRAVAEGFFRLLAYKDEYEVARLHLEGLARMGEEVSGAKPAFHMAPPLITRTDPATGRRRKIAVPGWLALPLFRVLRQGRRIRGTALDPFGWQEDRRLERALIGRYEADMAQALASLRPDTLDSVAELAELPLSIRGFGPVKQESARAAETSRTALLRRIAQPAVAVAAE